MPPIVHTFVGPYNFQNLASSSRWIGNGLSAFEKRFKSLSATDFA